MNKLSTLLIVFALLPRLSVQAGTKPELAASQIKPAMLANAHAVQRLYEMEVTVDLPESVLIREHYILTVLDKQGDDYARCVSWYSKLEKLQSIYGNLYDKNGKQLDKIKESDFMTFTNWAQAEYDDNKVKTYKASYREYPYTVEFFVESKQLHTFLLPWWTVQEHHDCSLEKGTLKLTAPKAFAVRYASLNGHFEPQVTAEKDNQIYTWNFHDIPAFKQEPMTGEFADGSPMILLAPRDFSMSGYTGNMKDWKNMGAFLYQLNKERDELSPDKKAKVKELTAGITDPMQKIRVLYSYMQENTRYVSIQFGIGGWQTISAASTCTNQYGDCKGLSNYMMSLLKEAGVKSYMVVICAGRETTQPMLPDFPAVQSFNHAILAVPVNKDTVWLECTSRDLPAGYLGSFTCDRDALMITPEGGVRVHTPVYQLPANRAVHRAEGQINEDGSISFSMRNDYYGLLAEQLVHLNELNDQQKDQWINNRFKLASYSASSYKQNRNDGAMLLGVQEGVNITANNMVNKAGDYKLVSMDLAPLDVSVDMQLTERKKQFLLRYSYTVTDSFQLSIPAGAAVSSLPEPVVSETPFGSFQLAVKRDGDKLVAVRKLVRRSGSFEPKQYAEYEAWVDNINNANHYKVVLKNK